jgi:RNA polymerase-binding transcription factor
MAISQLLPQTLAPHERERLREALARRRLGLSAALGLYEDGAGATSTRRALVRHTQLAIADIDRALARADEPGYGVCRSCRHMLSIEALTRNPLETHCSACIPGERSNWT